MNIVILDDYQDAVRKLACASRLDAYPAKVYTNTVKGIGQLSVRLKDADVIILIRERTQLSRQLIEKLPRLKLVVQSGRIGPHIDVEACTERGIAVVAAAGANAAAVAEQALALLLACAKSVVALDARMHAGHWDKATHKSLELGGRTVGLVGLGAIGLRFARMADALGMRVIGFDPFAKNLPAYVQPVDLETIWRESDAISLHCPLTEENRGMLGASTLAACRRGVIVVNTARGGLIDEAALLAAVRSGQVAAAGLDSFAVEPMVAGHPFPGERNFVLSPHIGGVTGDAYVNMGVGAARNVLEVLARVPAAAGA